MKTVAKKMKFDGKKPANVIEIKHFVNYKSYPLSLVYGFEQRNCFSFIPMQDEREKVYS